MDSKLQKSVRLGKRKLRIATSFSRGGVPGFYEGWEMRAFVVNAFEGHDSIISHFKFAAGMNVGEKKAQQLDRNDYSLEGWVVSIRLSTSGGLSWL